MTPWAYLDTGEIFATDEDGYPIGDPIVFLDVPDDTVGQMVAALPELLAAAEGLMNSSFAENYRLISPFKELGHAIAKARSGEQ